VQCSDELAGCPRPGRLGSDRKINIMTTSAYNRLLSRLSDE
jgi:hypothetical protein